MGGAIDPAALTTAQAAKLLSAMGLGPVTEDTILVHLAQGAPRNAEGRINLIHYAAWLVGQLAERKKMQGRS